VTNERTSTPAPRDRRRALRLAALVVFLATGILLVQFPPCGTNGEACAAMIGMETGAALQPASQHPAAGTSCPLAAAGGEGMECCEKDAAEQPAPVAPDAGDKQLRDKLQAQAPLARCPVDCVPCADDEPPRASEDSEGALPEVPLYTLLSSYLT
jgi:hypothetical protein